MQRDATLYHHGILGQKWGVRRTPEELGRHVCFRQSKMSIEEYVHACDLWRRCSEVTKLPDTKSRVLSSFTNNLTADEKEQSIVHTYLNNHIYTAINKGNEQYKIVRYKKIQGVYTDWLDEVLSKVIGENWRDYDDERCENN